jgi:hypothetical protein
MSHTNYSNYTDKELLQLLSDKRSKSPIIDELCDRLEEYSPAFDREENVKAECPVCEAKLNVNVDVSDLGNYQLILTAE